MNILILTCLSFFVGLFVLFHIARDDFTLLRKNVSLEEIFNFAFLVFAVGILSARIFFILFHPSWHYISPLVFITIPYFPGLSLLGGVIGASTYIYVASIQKKRMPTSRIFDIFSFVFATSLSLVWFLQLGGDLLQKNIIQFASNSIIVLMQSVLTVVFLHMFMKGKWKDGIVTYGILISIFSLTLLKQVVGISHGISMLTPENGGTVLGIIICILLLLRQEKFFIKSVKKY